MASNPQYVWIVTESNSDCEVSNTVFSTQEKAQAYVLIRRHDEDAKPNLKNVLWEVGCHKVL